MIQRNRKLPYTPGRQVDVHDLPQASSQIEVPEMRKPNTSPEDTVDGLVEKYYSVCK